MTNTQEDKDVVIADPGNTPGQWWRSPFAMYQTNLREIDVEMDVETVLDAIERHGADAWLIGAGGIHAYYPTELPFQQRSPFLSTRQSGDLLGDAVVAAHRRGMRLLARMDFSKVSAAVAAEHPEWCFVSPDGEYQRHTGGLVSVCPNGDYYQQKTLEILDELTRRYPVDGFFFNWFGFNEVDYDKVYHGVCHCLGCLRAFEEFAPGRDLPDGPESENYGLWLTFTDSCINRLTTRIRAFLSERLPDAGLILGHSADIVFHEANNELDRELWTHSTGEWVSTFRSYRPQVPTLVNSVMFMDMPYRMASEEPHQFAQYLVQAISRGANPSTYIMGTPGKIPYEGLDVAGEITRFYRRWRDIYELMSPAARTGIVRPSRLVLNADETSRATSEYRGLYSALQEEHIPFDVLAHEHLREIVASGRLRHYHLLVLPDLGRLDDDLARALDEFVHEGGSVITTGSTGFNRAGLMQLESSPAARRRASTVRKEQLWSSYVSPHGPIPTDANSYAGPIVPVYGAYHYSDWKADARRHWTFLPPAPFAPPEKAYGHVAVDHPGFALREHGAGRCAAVPWTVGRAYRDLGLTAVRRFFAEVVESAVAEPEPITADLPEQVELTVHGTDSRAIVHLLNHSGVRRNNVGPALPITGGALRTRRPVRRAYSLRAEAECEISDWLGGSVVQLPTFDLFDVIVIEFD